MLNDDRCLDLKELDSSVNRRFQSDATQSVMIQDTVTVHVLEAVLSAHR